MAPDQPRALAFVGPSLAGSLEGAIFPTHVTLRPPIRRGDMDALPEGVLDVLIIDGVFHSTLAVSAREILDAMHRGVRVYGSSSMGALRAAELDQFGMIGVGTVYEMYRSGQTESDAEVALIFDPDTLMALSEPLVNIRYSIRCALAAGVIDNAMGKAIVSVAKDFPYRELTFDALFRRLSEHIPNTRWKEYVRFIDDNRAAVDLKRLDAIELARAYADIAT